jgi:hypothetical protein
MEFPNPYKSFGRVDLLSRYAWGWKSVYFALGLTTRNGGRLRVGKYIHVLEDE